MEERLDRLHKAAAGIGWEYGDTVAEIVGELRDPFDAQGGCEVLLKLTP